MSKKTNFTNLFDGPDEKPAKIQPEPEKAVTSNTSLFEFESKKHPHQLTAIYIACYMGKKDSDIREARWEILLKQLNEFKALDQYLINMEFTDEEFAQLNDLGYKIHFLNDENKAMRLDQARNVSLKYFYNSDHDFAFIADNDAWLNTELLGGATALDEWNNCDSQDAYLIDRIDMWSPVSRMMSNPSYGFKSLYPNYIAFQQKYGNKGSLRALRNLKKHKGIEIYLPDLSHSNQGEDYLFEYTMLQHGLESWCFMNVHLVEECPKGASFFAVGGNANNRDFENGLRNVEATLKEPRLKVKSSSKKKDPTAFNYSLDDKEMRTHYLTSAQMKNNFLKILK